MAKLAGVVRAVCGGLPALVGVPLTLFQMWGTSPELARANGGECGSWHDDGHCRRSFNGRLQRSAKSRWAGWHAGRGGVRGWAAHHTLWPYRVTNYC
eukprot:COSAG01_NODE_41086_length_456_cov_0.577031_1_plen_96_part_10